MHPGGASRRCNDPGIQLDEKGLESRFQLACFNFVARRSLVSVWHELHCILVPCSWRDLGSVVRRGFEKAMLAYSPVFNLQHVQAPKA